MARHGFIKIHRRMFDNPIVMKDAEYLAIWVYLLGEAKWKPEVAYFNGKKIMLQPGQFTIGRKQIADKLRVTESKCQRVLKCYETEHLIEQQTCNRNRLISIVKWNEYQLDEQLAEQPVNNQRTTSEQPVNTPEEYKNIRNKEIESIYGEFGNVKLSDSEYEKLVERFPMDYQDKIENLSVYLKKTGKKYKSHYATILSWDRKDQRDKKKSDPKGRLDWIDDLIKEERANDI